MDALRDNPAAGRLEMDEAGQIVFATYRRQAGNLIIDHVEAPNALRGAGAAGRFMQALVTHAATTGETIIPVCGYAAAWLRRHPSPSGRGLNNR